MIWRQFKDWWRWMNFELTVTFENNQMECFFWKMYAIRDDAVQDVIVDTFSCWKNQSFVPGVIEVRILPFVIKRCPFLSLIFTWSWASQTHASSIKMFRILEISSNFRDSLFLRSFNADLIQIWPFNLVTHLLESLHYVPISMLG